MDNVNASQLVLLSILVAFVTSIATTIIAISLLSDTELSITQITNPILERERLVEVDREQLKAELLAELSVDIAQPQVAGVSTTGFSMEQVEELYAALWDDPYYILDPASRLVVGELPEGYAGLYGPEGVYTRELSPEVGLVHSVDFVGIEIGHHVVQENETVLRYDAERGITRTYVQNMDTAKQGQYALRLVGLAECSGGDMVVSELGELVGICVDSSTAVTDISKITEPVDELVQVTAEASLESDGETESE